MRKPQTEIQKAYRDRKRGRPPRPYRKKLVAENLVTLKVQELVNFAFYHQVTSWRFETLDGRLLDIRISHTDNPNWLEVNGVRFRLSKWTALGGITDRWAIETDQHQRRIKIYVLDDGRIGYRQQFGIIYKTQQETTKKRRLKMRKKIIETITKQTVSPEYIEAHPDFIPARPKNKRKGKTGLLVRKRKYQRLTYRLKYPGRKLRKQLEGEGIIGGAK